MRELERDAYYDLTQLGTVTVSPDGDRLAYVAHEFDPVAEERRRSVFVVPTDGSRPPHRLTRVADAGDPAWSPDGTRLAVRMARERDTYLCVERSALDDAGGADDAAADDERVRDADSETGDPESQVWVFDLERSGDARQVTTFAEGVESFDWSPDGERLVVAARDPTEAERDYLDERRAGGPVVTERLQHKFEGDGWLDTVRTYLFVVDVATRETRRLDDAYGGGAAEPMTGLAPAWSPDGERIAFLSNRTPNPDDTYVEDVYTVAPDGSDCRRLTDGTFIAMAPRFSPDGEHVAFAGLDPGDWYHPAEVYVVDASGDRPARSLSAALDRTVAWGGYPQWLDDETLLALIGDEGRTRFCRFPLDGDPERAPVARTDGASVRPFDVAGGTVGFVRSHPSEGRNVYATPASSLGRSAASTPSDDASGTDTPIDLTDLNRALLDGYPRPECREFTVDSDGVPVHCLLYHPPAVDPDDPERHPLILSIHGGPTDYDEPHFDFEYTYWTSRGYLLLQVNYRGSTSFGREFSDALKGRWNTVEVDDLLAGVESTVERGWADPDRLFVTGFSQGGTNTAYVLARSDRFAAGAAEHGIYDLRSAFGTDDAQNSWAGEFGLPWERPEAYDHASAVTSVDRIDTPLLVTAGGEDWRCPPTQSEQLYVSLRKRGVPARLVVYPDEDHAVTHPDRAIHRLRELTNWFARFDPATE